MKGFKEVAKTRVLQNAQPNVNSVHRSSLLVPEISGCDTEISFVNHFLIKRGIAHVGCRITGIDAQGGRIESRLHAVTQARVYRFDLSGAFSPRAASYMVEFFAPENLFVPFPAVMINHYGRAAVNTVHAYNRVLNDVFEEDGISSQQVAETYIDVTFDRDIDTVCCIMSGVAGLAGDVDFRLDVAGKEHHARVAVAIPRFGVAQISLRETFGHLGAVAAGLLRVTQPRQPMFYGRVLAGRTTREGFSGNHSYYDTSGVVETFDDDRASATIAPYFAGSRPRVRMHPVLSPGTIALAIQLFAPDGRALGRASCGELHSPHGTTVVIDVDAHAAALGVDRAALGTFAIEARPIGGNTPTRIGANMVYGAARLEGVAVVQLANPNSLGTLKSRTWGQAIVGGEYTTLLGIVADLPDHPTADVHVAYYSEAGKLRERTITLPTNGLAQVDIGAEVAGLLRSDRPGPVPVWFYITAQEKGIKGYTQTVHHKSGAASVEHTF